MLLAVGEHFLGSITDREQRLATGFSGGVGNTLGGHCGVFSAGVMIIGALYGRSSPTGDDEDCQELTRRFQIKFQKEYGTLNCRELRASGYGSEAEQPCSVLVEKSGTTLVTVIEEFQQEQ